MSDDDEGAEARAALAANVIAARNKRGMTQVDLSSATGIAQQKISAIEQGSENVTLRTLARLAHALGVSETALLRKPGKD